MKFAPLSRRAFAAGVAASSYSRVLGANDRIRVGMIGVGGRGSENIREIVRVRDLNVTITGICDVWRPNRERAAATVEKQFGEKPKATTNYLEMMGWKDIDAVVIATPDFSHPIILKAAVEAGKDAYVEKPFGVTFEDAKAAYLAVKRSKQVVQVGTQRRSDGRYQAAAKLVQSGALGKITRVEIGMHFQQQRWKRPEEKIDPADVDWAAFQMGRIRKPFDPRLLREWQLFPETTNGIPGLWMCHFIDLVPWYTGDPYPAGAVSNGGVFLWKDGRKTSDVFYTLLDYPKEMIVMFSMSLTNSAGVRDMWFGTRGTLDGVKWVASGEGSVQKDKLAEAIAIKPEPTNSHMHNFLECVRSRQQPRADVQAGFSHAVAVIMSAEALEKGRRIRFDPNKLELI